MSAVNLDCYIEKIDAFGHLICKLDSDTDSAEKLINVTECYDGRKPFFKGFRGRYIAKIGLPKGFEINGYLNCLVRIRAEVKPYSFTIKEGEKINGVRLVLVSIAKI